MRVGQVPPGLCACSQGLSWSAPWRGLPGEREPLSFNSIEHAYDRWLDADPTAVNPLPFAFVLATAERAVVDTLGRSRSHLGRHPCHRPRQRPRARPRPSVHLWHRSGQRDPRLVLLGGGDLLRCIAPSAVDVGGLGLASSGGVVPLRLSLDGRDAAARVSLLRASGRVIYPAADGERCGRHEPDAAWEWLWRCVGAAPLSLWPRRRVCGAARD
jgi:hypothetical protein